MSLFHPKLIGGYLINVLISEGVKKENIDYLIVGCSLTANLGPSLSLQMAQTSSVNGQTKKMTIQDGAVSGMKALQLVADLQPQNGLSVIVAAENMSLAPHYLPMARWKTSFGDQRLIDSLRRDVLTDPASDINRGMMAEAQIKKGKLTRSKLDEYTKRSLGNLSKALGSKVIKNEIAPFRINDGNETRVAIEIDETPATRPDDALKDLKPIFMNDGTLTAGNSAGISDGAALLLCATADAVKKYDLEVIAEVLDITDCESEPKDYIESSVNATKKLLENQNLQVDDIDIFEVHEDFASTPLLVAKALKIPKSKLNPRGGALGIGDAGAASGIRLLGSLANQLQTGKHQYGIATISDVTGYGAAVLLKRV